MLSDHEHNISVLSNLGLIERCNKPNTNTNTNKISVQRQIQSVIDANIIPGVIELMIKGDFKSQKEAVWVITNLTSGG